jgi:hypothetical protein
MNAKDLILNENAYFYKLEKKITKKVIRSIFSNVLKEKEIDKKVLEELREKYSHINKVITYSLLVFSFKDEPTFITDPKAIKPEIKYAYLLIFEYDKFVIIIKKNVSGLKEIYDYLEPLEYYTISRLFITEKSSFEKINMKNVDISNNVIRNRTLEAMNLKNSLPFTSGNRNILNSLRLANDDSRYAVSLNTSRVNQLGSKQEFVDLVPWIIKTIHEIKNFKSKKVI